MEIKHCVGITCEGFEDEFMTLLTTIEARYAHTRSDPYLNSAKIGGERDRELKRLTLAIN